MSNQIERDSNNEERIGVSAVSLAFEKMGWTFRERTHSDYGIDADVEQKIDGKRTNRHIALQIKSGESYIKVKKNNKITFSIDQWHYSYWLQSDRPVLIIMYDSEADKIYWEQVKLSNIDTAIKHRKIEIDITKTLDKNCIDELNNIIDTYVKHDIYPIDDKLVNYDYSITCTEEYGIAVSDLVNKLAQFKLKLETHISNPVTDRLVCQLDVFGLDVKKHIEDDYALLHKACWYLAFLCEIIDLQLAGQLLDTLESFTNNLLIQKASWLTNIDNFKKLFHNNLPSKIHRSNKKVIQYIEEYTALIDLSLNDFTECRIQIENRLYGKNENAES